MNIFEKTIFISMPAYNEEDLQQTIKSALSNAEYPDRIYFGIFYHNSEEQHENINYPNTRVIYAKYPNTLGIGISRANAASLYDGQDYFFQIDSHMLFEKKWDSKILLQMENLLNITDKPIISTYVPWWARLEDGTILQYSPESNFICSPMKYMGFLYEGHPAFTLDDKTYENGKDYIEHYGIAGHFIFTVGSFQQDVMPDPLDMFEGEEETIAVRAWTRGYRIFCIKNPIAFHKNKGIGILNPKDRRHYFGPQDEHDFYVRKNKIFRKRTRDILTGKIVGYWGAESLEKLREYEMKAGIDFNKVYNI